MMATLAEKLRRAKEDESGAALITTVGLMLFTFMVVIALMYSSIVAIKVDSSVRAGETIDSSYDSALNQALASATLGNPNSTTTGNTCVPAVAKNAQGASYQIYRTASTTKPATVNTAGVSKGCPVDGDTYMMIETKSAESTKTVTSTYKWTNPQNGFDGHVAGTSAVTAQSAAFTYSPGSVTVTSGNYTCSGNTTIDGSIYVPNGTLTLTDNCTIAGSVYADNLVVKSSNVVISPISGAPYNGSVYLTGSISVAAGVNFNLGPAGRLYSSGTDALTLPKPPTGGASITALMLAIKGNLTLPAGSRIDANVQAATVLATGAATVNGYIRATGPINNSSTAGALDVNTTAAVTSSYTGAYTMYNVKSSNGIEIGTPTTTAVQNINNSEARFIISHGVAANTYTNINTGTVVGQIEVNGAFKGLTGNFTSIFSSRNSVDNLLTNVKYSKTIGVNGTINSASKYTYNGSGIPVIFKGQKDLYSDSPVNMPAAMTWTVPAIQTWQDYSFKATDWTGYRIISPSSCDYTAQAAVDQLNNLQNPTILDLRNCNTINFTGVSLKLKTSVAILSKSFSTSASSFNSAFTNMSVSGADTTVHAFYIINTDDTADGVPTCNNATTGQLGLNNTNFGQTLRVVTYTPCATTVNYDAGSSWTGQIYSGVLTYNTFNIKYARVYIPGFPTTASSSTTFSASASNRATPLLVDRVSTKPTNVN